MARQIIWALAVAASVASISYATMAYEIEVSKNNAFMMKVCTESGGRWITGWRINVWWCERPPQS